MSIFSSIRTAVRLGTIEALTQSGYSNIPVIYSHQNGTEPAGTYVVLQVINLQQKGRTEESTFTTGDTDTKQITFKSHFEGLIQIRFGGTDAGDIATEFYNAIPGNVVVREAYQKNNLAPIRKSAFRYSPQKRDTEWVDFFTVDVTFSYMVLTEQDVDWVNTVQIVNTYTGEVITTSGP